jgi:hypothetical protein
MNKYYIIKFNDLSENKQEEIKNDIANYLVENNYLVNSELLANELLKSWCELGVNIPDETSEDKWRTDAYLEGGDK